MINDAQMTELTRVIQKIAMNVGADFDTQQELKNSLGQIFSTGLIFESFKMPVIGHPELTCTVTMNPNNTFSITPDFTCEASIENDTYNVTGPSNVTVDFDSVTEENVLRYEVALWDNQLGADESVLNITPTGPGSSYSTALVPSSYSFGDDTYVVIIRAVYINGAQPATMAVSGNL